MDDVRPEPRQRLAGGARRYWALEALWRALAAFVVALVAARVLREHDGAWHTLGIVVPVLTALLGATAVAVVPALRWRRWRWELRDDELDLRRGTFTVTRTIVPISRVQHVDVHRSPLGQLCDVSTVAVHTAAGRTEIPALDAAAAARVRDRIADLTHVPDDL